MARTAIQLYTLRGIDQPLPDVLRAVGETSFDAVEFAHRVGDADLKAVVEALEETDLEVAAAHVGLDRLESEHEETTAFYAELGCTDLVVPWLDPSNFESEEAVGAVAERLNQTAAALDGRGFCLHYHNHDQEFVDCGDRTAVDELLERTDDSIGFEIDLGWANAAGGDPVDLFDRYGDRITHVHFADADSESMSCVELGEGDLDLDACVEAAHDASIEWHIYEHDEPTNPHESLLYGAQTLDSFR
ncbi:inosose dehydratase [Halalkalicoccus paucihalophilus]|uniref:Inosose dehydratase n=1 Tax=Halalkalicoccus paucihalophilus TaxID=1008153 RepID=A0A151ACP7_9EURY|nr:sugar phosphate isomerase/epimerase [Halalkalicoccus paucihalophilus]KYH25425.1 inosose dehydratase [Halalkalicoccus paucihalophilus]